MKNDRNTSAKFSLAAAIVWSAAVGCGPAKYLSSNEIVAHPAEVINPTLECEKAWPSFTRSMCYVVGDDLYAIGEPAENDAAAVASAKEVLMTCSTTDRIVQVYRRSIPQSPGDSCTYEIIGAARVIGVRGSPYAIGFLAMTRQDGDDRVIAAVQTPRADFLIVKVY